MDRIGPLRSFARLVERAGTAAGFAFKEHSHMLRHACGFALADAGHDTRSLQAYLGHRNIQHTSGTPSWRRTGSRISGGSWHGNQPELETTRSASAVRVARADARAADLAPLIAELRASGVTTLRGIAVAQCPQGSDPAGAWRMAGSAGAACAGAAVMAPILGVQCFLARTALGWSASHLGRAAGVSYHTVQCFERGDSYQ
jgi:Phage integrase family